MPFASPIQTSFTAGELGPRLGGRIDLAAYGSGVAEMLNFVPTVEGPALKRSGTRLVQAAKSSTAMSRVIPFEARLTQAYVIEAGNLYFRYYTNDGQILSAGTPYETVTPYTTAQLADLQYEPSADVLYLVHGSHQQRVLKRTGAETFALELLELTGGPFKDQNTDQAITVAASATTGSVTLTASSAIFQAGHVGSLFSIEAIDFQGITAWEPGIEVAATGQLRTSEGKVYKATALPASGSKRTGTIAPTHTEGRAWDGMSSGQDINAKGAGGVQWEYQYDRYGIVKITAVASGTSATATVIRPLADQVVSGNTWRWAHALFSAVEGWPTHAAIWNERLVLARGNVLAGSVVGDYANHAKRDAATGQITTDLAFVFVLPDPNPIEWIAADRLLLIGTSRAEYALGPANNAQAPGPGNLQAPRQGFAGGRGVRPVQAGTRTLFVQRAGRKLRELGYSYDSDRYVAPDLTVRSRHISRGGLIELAFQQEPEALLWAVRGDGVLACLTYAADQEVRGWSRHILGGHANDQATLPARVESICVIPDPAGERDQLWLSVYRRINGADYRSIERLETFWEDGDALTGAFFVDCGLTYSGSPVTTVAGLSHLAGQTVQILADGSVHDTRVVPNSGSITLDRAASTVTVGLGFTARLTTMRVEAGQGDGTAQAKIKRIIKVGLRLLETLGLWVGQPQGRYDEVRARPNDIPMDAPPPLFTGDESVGYPGGYGREGQVSIESRQPLPACIVSLMPDVETMPRS